MQINSIQSYQNCSNASFKGIYIPQNRIDIAKRVSRNTIKSLREFDTNSVMQKVMPAIMQKFCEEAEIIVEFMINDMGLKTSNKVKILIRNAIINKANEILENAKKDEKTSDFDLSVVQYYREKTGYGGGRDACGAYCEPWTYTYTERSSDRYAFRNNNFPIPFFIRENFYRFNEDPNLLEDRENEYYFNSAIKAFRSLLDPEDEEFSVGYITLEDGKGNPTSEQLIQKLITENAELNEILNNLKTSHETKKLLNKNTALNGMLTDKQKRLLTKEPYQNTKVVEVPPLCDTSDSAFKMISIW